MSTGAPASTKTRSTKPRTMTDDHKKAIAQGREEAQKVGKYLEYVETHRPKRGRKASPETRRKRLAEIEASLADSVGVERLLLMQEKLDVEAELKAMDVTPDVDPEALEADFVQVAKSFASRKRVKRSTLVAFGVKPDVLKAAGL